MRGAILAGWGATPQVRTDLAAPRISSPDDVVVDVEYALIGLGDMFITRGIHYRAKEGVEFQFPHVPSLRGVGKVAEAGRDARVPVGTPVAINGVVGCARCSVCRRGAENVCPNQYLTGVTSGHWGSLAEQMVIPSRQVHPLSESSDHVRTLVAPDVALLLRAFRVGKLTAGENVVVVGAGRAGGIGVQIARFSGAARVVVVDPDADAREAAMRAGADEAISPVGLSNDEVVELVKSATGGGGHVVLEAVGSPEAIQLASMCARPLGRCVLLGTLGPTTINFEQYYNTIVRPETTLVGSYGKTNREFAAAIDLVQNGTVDVSRWPIQVFELDEIDKAWQIAMSDSGARLAIRCSS